MKISFILLTVCTLTLSASVFPQSKKITLSLKNVTIREAFDEIEKQSGFKFFYINEQVDVNRKVDVVANNTQIEDVLNTLFASSEIKYKVFENNLVVISPNLTSAQQVKVSGKVTDAQTGESLPGVNIIIQGTTLGVTTDIDGKYTIELPNTEATLVFSYIGYLTETVKYAGQASLDVSMVPDIKKLDEIVVIGYGTAKKSDVTGALTSVSADKLTSRPVNNAFEALQGKAAGVDITSAQRPGEIGSIRIRGNRSINAGNEPLYVVDGVVLSAGIMIDGVVVRAGGIESINPHDIESVNVLKDASSTAIYGSRGANGVVLITTKRGQAGAMKLNYSGAYTFEKLHDLSPVMKSGDYITWLRWARHNSNPALFNPGNQPSQVQDETIFGGFDVYTRNNVMKGWESGTWDASKVANSNWTDIVTQTGITQEHTLSASGGTEKMKSYGSVGYLKNEGTQRGQLYERYNFTLSTDITATDWFSMGGSINGSWSNQDYGFSRTGQSTNSGPTEIYAAAKQLLEISPAYDDNGEIIFSPGNFSSIYTVMDEWSKSIEKRQTLRALGSFYGNINFGKIWKGLEGLNFKTNFGPDFRYYRRGVYLDKSSAVRGGVSSYGAWEYQRTFSWVLDNILSYNKTINIHKFDFTFLQSASKYDREEARMSEINILKPSYLWNKMGAVDILNSANNVTIGTELTQSQLLSIGVRLNYSLMDKYLLTLTGRYDGSSVLAEGHRSAFFPSIALGWRLEQEEFLKDISWLDHLKLRLGYGVTGNAAISVYGTLGNIRSFYVPMGGQGNAIAYSTNEPYYFADPVKMANPGLVWEKTKQYNLGIDFGVFRGRINGTIDIYRSYTSDLIMQMNIPPVSGYLNTIANVGKTENKGFEISLNFIPVKTNAFEWNSSLNTAWQMDKIVELSNGKNDMPGDGWYIGESISVFAGYDNAGLWQESDAAEIAKWNTNVTPDGQPKSTYNFTPGNVRPVDKNGDYQLTDDDRVILGNLTPRWTFGWSNSVNYKGIELNIELYGRMGYMVSTGGEAQGGIPSQRQIDYWRPDNTGAKWQKPIYTGTPGVSGDYYASLLGFKDAAFIKFRNVSLGYFLPAKICNNLKMRSLKVYAQLRNPGYLYSSVDFIDLDLGTSTYYNRGITFGVEVGL